MRIKTINIFVILIFLTSLAACNGEWTHYPIQPVNEQSKNNNIAIGNTITVHIFDQPSLSGNHDVASNGTITLPFIESVYIEGLSLQEAAKKIRTEFISKGYFINPQVTVLPSPSQQTIMIMGEVLSNGEYPYKEGMTILDLVAKSGGFNDKANQENFDIIRKNSNGMDDVVIGTISTRVQSGDLIRIRKRPFS